MFGIKRNHAFLISSALNDLTAEQNNAENSVFLALSNEYDPENCFKHRRQYYFECYFFSNN